MRRLRSITIYLLATALVGCSPNQRQAQPEPSPSPSPATVTAPGSGVSCRPPEPELHNAARSVVGDITVAKPGIEGDADRVEVIVCKTTDSRATATVTVYGQRDDSVRDTRHELVLDKLVARGWVVSSDVATYRCQPGRGHQDFAPDLCA
jgi:hypothetical protein